jgi:hypothetical protein
MNELECTGRSHRPTPFSFSVESEQLVGVTQKVTLPHRLVSALVSVSCVTRVVLVGTG